MIYHKLFILNFYKSLKIIKNHYESLSTHSYVSVYQWVSECKKHRPYFFRCKPGHARRGHGATGWPKSEVGYTWNNVYRWLGKSNFIGNIQGIYREYTGNIQGIYPNIQGIYREYIGNIQGIDREYIGNIQGIDREYIYICIYVCVYIYIYIYMCVYIYIYIYIDVVYLKFPLTQKH